MKYFYYPVIELQRLGSTSCSDSVLLPVVWRALSALTPPAGGVGQFSVARDSKFLSMTSEVFVFFAETFI